MSRLIVVLALAAAAGGYFTLQKYKIDGLEHLKLQPRDAVSAADAGAAAPHAGGVIRIASFHLREFTFEKLSRPAVVRPIAEVIRRFDVVALQGISSPRDDVLPRLIDEVNGTGRRYDFVAGPRSGREPDVEQ